MRPVFITATNTGIGKTFIAAAIINLLKKNSHGVFPFKPVQSGCLNSSSDLNLNDALLLKTAAASQEPIDIINPYSFKDAVSPHLAAKISGTRVDISIFEEIVSHQMKQNAVIIEGAGGVMSPVTDAYLNSDIASLLKATAIVVSPPALGTINQTLLTIEHLQNKKIPVLGFIANGNVPDNGFKPEYAIDSFEFIQKKSGVPLIGTFGYLGEMDLNSKSDRELIFIGANKMETYLMKALEAVL